MTVKVMYLEEEGDEVGVRGLQCCRCRCHWLHDVH